MSLQAKTRLPFAVLCTVPFIMVLGNSMLIPLLPTIKSVLDISLARAGLIITAFSLPAGLMIPLAGYLSDRYGRKIIMVPALVVYGIGGLIAGAAALFLDQPFMWIIAGRIVQGLGAGGTYQLAMALTGDIFTSQERVKALGMLEASNGLGKVVSPIAGSALGLLFWFAPFFVYGVLAIPIALAVWLIAKEPQKAGAGQAAQQSYFQQVIKVFQKKGVQLLLLFMSGGLALFALFGVLSYVSDILEIRYGFRGMAIGLLLAIPVGTMALTSYFSGTYLQKQPASDLKIFAVAGLGMVVAGLTIMALLPGIYLLFIGLAVQGLGTGLILPAVNTLITGSTSTSQRGIVTCLYGSARFFGVALGPPAFALVLSWGQRPFFLLVAGGLTALTLLAWFLLNAEQLLPPQAATSS